MRPFKRALALLLAAVLAFALCGCSSSDYAKAQKLLESGSYAEAEELFLSLDDYKDSAELVKECRYLLAGAALSEGSYAEAAGLYESLGDYKDSADQLPECRYLQATEAMEQADYETAIELFEALDGYKDAGELKNEAEETVLIQALTGSWHGSGDATATFAERNSDFGPYLESCPFDLSMVFADDGTYTYTMDFTPAQESFQKAVRSLLEQSLNDNGVSVEDFEAYIDTDLDSYVSDVSADMVSVQEGQGVYTIKDGEVILDEGSSGESTLILNGDSIELFLQTIVDSVTLTKD